MTTTLADQTPVQVRRASSPIRLVALDIDGTLVNPEGHVSPRTALAVRAVLAQGVLVVLCTGRTFSKGIGQLGRELGLHLPAIVRNGAAVQDIASGQVLAQRSVPAEVVRAALDIIFAAGATPLVQEGALYGDAIHLPPQDEHHPAVAHFTQLWSRDGDVFAHLPSRAALYAAREPWWIGGASTHAVTAQVYEAMQRIPGVLSRWSGHEADNGTVREHHMASVVPEGCTKAAALAEYAAEHDIGLTEVFAVGDYFNDLEMLREVGFGVAMGHAPDAVKAVAKAIAPDNAHDGCAVALGRYVLGRA